MNRLRGIVLALLALLLSATPAVAQPVDGWTKPTLLHIGGRLEASVIDEAGTVHSIVADHGLWYLADQTATHIVKRHGSGFVASIVVRPDDQAVFVAWTDGAALWLTRRIGGSWVSSRLWIGDARQPSMVRVGSGVAVAFNDAAKRLRYLRWDPVDGPSSASIVVGDCCIGGAALAMKGGDPLIVYSRRGDRHLMKALRTAGGDWAVRTLDYRATVDPVVTGTPTGRVAIAFLSGEAIWCLFDNGDRCLGLGGQGPFYGEPSIASGPDGRVLLSGMLMDVGAGTRYYEILVRDLADGRAKPAMLTTRNNIYPDRRPDPFNGAIGVVDGKAVVVFASNGGASAPRSTGQWVTRQE